MIKAVSFDLDGTLVDSTALLSEAQSEAFAQFGVVASPSEFKKYGGLSIKDLAGSIMGAHAGESVDSLRQKRKDFTVKNINRLGLFPETIHVLKELRSLGIKTGIATGLCKDLLPIFLERAGIASLIDVNVSADDVPSGKPAPDVFLRSFELMGVEGKDGLIVGDSENDILAARTARIPCVLVNRDGPTTYRADYIIKNLEELLEIVRKS